MKVLVLGGHGMAGHMIRQVLTTTTEHEVCWTVRQPTSSAGALVLNAEDGEAVRAVVGAVQPDVIVNAIGILNQFADHNPLSAIRVNSLLPHQLAQLGDLQGFRLIHISTDCVFDGERGAYAENDVTNGVSVYAKTKSLGEVRKAPHLTVRTSIIGPECKADGIGLFHWFMQQHGEVSGYTRVFWNGVTTLELAKFIAAQLNEEEHLSGLVHVSAAERISKHDLLAAFSRCFDRKDIVLRRDDGPRSDKTLLSTRSDMTWMTPDYDTMLLEMRTWMQRADKEVYRYAQ